MMVIIVMVIIMMIRRRRRRTNVTACSIIIWPHFLSHIRPLSPQRDALPARWGQLTWYHSPCSTQFRATLETRQACSSMSLWGHGVGSGGSQGLVGPECQWYNLNSPGKKTVLASCLHNFKGKARFASGFITPVSGLRKIRHVGKQMSHTQMISKYHICSKLNILFLPAPSQFLTLICEGQHVSKRSSFFNRSHKALWLEQDFLSSH